MTCAGEPQSSYFIRWVILPSLSGGLVGRAPSQDNLHLIAIFGRALLHRPQDFLKISSTALNILYLSFQTTFRLTSQDVGIAARRDPAKSLTPQNKG